MGEDNLGRLEVIVTATQINQWAGTREAQAILPVLVRRLILATCGSPNSIQFPGGDSINQPGWDGEVECVNEVPWVPQGKSFWELSCEARPTRKANRDYEKRIRQTPVLERSDAAFVFVTAREWTTKNKWLREKRKGGEWKEVRAYDANDLEQWLEQAPAVALWFAETLGITGQGVESLEQYWSIWASQSNPPISPDALFVDRENVREWLIHKLREHLREGRTDPLTIHGDSVEEAAAFVCAAILQEEDMSAVSLVVTEPNGWRFVDANPAVKVAVAARPEVAERPSTRRDLVVVIPYALSDMAGHYRGAVARGVDTGLVLERPRRSGFEEAIVELGLDKADAERLTLNTGRSWSVFRRHCAKNPAIRRPKWMEMAQAVALTSICLLGAWKGDNSADREIVSRLAGHPYEDVERELRYLAQVDDAPVLQIGTVWKAKSPLELFDLFGERITSTELGRFFEIAYDVLTVPDPVLDLPEEERYAAQVYGKVRTQSDILINSLCDTLIKLAVRGPILPSLQALDIERRVAKLVHDLLYNADRVQWLSLSPFLQPLAEAAPETFLRAVEHSLNKPDQPVISLLRETSDSALFGRCWHSTLLWALEVLAWSPRFMPRVARVLAKLAHIEIKGNWANTPLNSLVGIFRSWYPQTAASLEERITVLDLLVRDEPDIAFDLLCKLIDVGRDIAHPAERPRWRDYDSGFGYGATREEIIKMSQAAADRIVPLAKGHPDRVACLIEKIDVFDETQRKDALDLVAEFANSGALDKDREIVRAALRKIIHWHRNHDKTPEPELSEKLGSLEEVYEKVAPGDTIIRYCWLFADRRPDLPTHLSDDYSTMVQQLEDERVKAFQDIYNELGMVGVERLATTCSQEPWIGFTLAKLGLPTGALADWILDLKSDFSAFDPLSVTVRGLLRGLPRARAVDLIWYVLRGTQSRNWTPEKVASFLTLARPGRTTWDTVASCGSEVERAYWRRILELPDKEDDMQFALRWLLQVGRPRTAFYVCSYCLDKVDPRLIADILEQVLRGVERGGPRLNSRSIGRAIEVLEASGVIETSRLVSIEFFAFPFLGYGNEQQVKTLYATLMSEPALFCELISIAYKPRHRKVEEIEVESEARKAMGGIARDVLQNCQRLPGTQPNGTIDPGSFFQFIDEVRNFCQGKDRLEVCDMTLGRMLAYSPVGGDGIWPFDPARDILERPELEVIQRGFVVGTFNKRGVTSRLPDEGGAQEHNLADKYRSYAKDLRMSYPNLASALDKISDVYEQEGRREDLETDLYLEGIC